LLEGLEISELFLSNVNAAHIDFRFDPEFYSKANLKKEAAVKKLNNGLLGNLCNLITGPFGSAIKTEDYVPDDKYRYIRATDIKSFFLNDNAPVFVGEETFNKFPRFHLQENDILLTVVGMNFGIPAIIQKEDCPAIFSCKSTLIRGSSVNPYYLLAYLSSSFGHELVRRGYRGAAQPGINLSDIESVLVPIVGNDFQRKIESQVKRSRSVIADAKTTYRKAETLLLNTLGMANFSTSAEAINIKSFKDSFAATGRLDAEYYQPKYEDYQVHVQSYPHGWLPLMQACGLKDDNFTPDEATAYQYIELADIDTAGGIAGCTEAVGGVLPSRARRKVEVGDVLVSSVEGSLSSCAIVPSVMDGALCSTGFYVVRSNKINAETLLVLFKSPLMQNLLKQGCSGTILTAINKAEFQNIPIPIIEAGAQSKIAALIKESFALKAESERLLESAKRAVEIAIEQSEEAALDYLALAQKE